MAADTVPHVYSLTELTGRFRNDERRWIVLSFEVRRHTAIVSGLSLLASAPVAALLALVVGPYALILPVLAVVAGLFLWDARQRRGLRLKNWQAILDKRRADNKTIFASGEVLGDPILVMHQQTVIPAQPDASPVVPAFGPGRQKKRPKRSKKSAARQVVFDDVMAGSRAAVQDVTGRGRR